MAEKKIEPVLSKKHPIGIGTQDIYRFKNGYGASVVKFLYHGTGSYGAEAGLFELAVIKFRGDKDNKSFEVDSTTPITNDVLGWQTPEDVQKTLKKIARLPKTK